MNNKKSEKEKAEKKTLYKYRSLQNLKRVLEILVKGELYGAKPNELNDPMEAYFLCLDKSSLSVKIMEEKFKNAYICSLSKQHNIGLMWSHYADGHKGCCIEVEVEENGEEWKECDVKYDFNQKKITKDKHPLDLLKIKSKAWKYEEECRYVKIHDGSQQEDSQFLKVNVKRIYLGVAVSDEDFELYKKTFKALVPNLKDEDVIHLTKEKIEW